MSCRLRVANTLKHVYALKLALVLLLSTPFASAQNNVGDLLDAGAKPITPEEFKQDVVQRVLAGPTASGGSVEMMYASTGSIVGTGTVFVSNPAFNYGPGSITRLGGE